MTSPSSPALNGSVTSSPRVTACVCTVNRAAFLDACLRSLLTQSLPRERYEILVVDNGSTDSTPEVCARFAEAGVRYVREPVSGLSRARNVGWQNARGEYIGYLDDDATASVSWLESALWSFQQIVPEPDWVGGPIRLAWDVPPPPWITPELRVPLGEVDLGAEPRFLAAGERLGGGNSFYSCRRLAEMNGFDVRLGRQNRSLLSGEETQFQHRIQAAGGRLFYHPGVEIHHFAARERLTPAWFRRRYYWGGRSDAVMQRTLDTAPRNPLQREPPTEALPCRFMRNLGFALGLCGSARRIQGGIYLAYVWGRVVGRLTAGRNQGEGMAG